jgi:hypothetical protein
MAKVVAVHGIGNTYSGADLLESGWRAALLSSVALAGGRGELAPDDIECVFYGQVFRPPGRLLGDDAPSYETSDVEEGLEAELLGAWWAAAAESDPAVVPPDARTLGIRSSVQSALDALLSSRFAGRISESTLIFWPKQVKAYLADPRIRSEIQDLFAKAIRPDTKVVVAHSLGSVIAYEVLRSPVHDLGGEVSTLVTLGSPLGVRPVQERVAPDRTWPPGVAAWTNISDPLDFVAAVKKLRPIFGGPLDDISVDNGLQAHDVTRYLTARETGEAVRRGLK